MLYPILLLASLLSYGLGTDWSYHDPEHWGLEFPTCRGQQQSPIDLCSGELTHHPSLTPIVFHNYNHLLTNLTLVNNGHSIQVNVPEEPQLQLLPGGPLSDPYRLVQFHFHWAPLGKHEGSEHTLGGRHLNGEMHLVHLKGNLTMEEATQIPDGIAVLAIFLHLNDSQRCIGECDNDALKPLTSCIQSVDYRGEKCGFQKALNLSSVLPESRDKYITYNGSLTTPACNESVVWVILNEAIPISSMTLYNLEKIRSDNRSQDFYDVLHGLDDRLLFNDRPTQPTFGRTIRITTDVRDVPPCLSTSTAPSLASSFLSSLLSLALISLLV